MKVFHKIPVFFEGWLPLASWYVGMSRDALPDHVNSAEMQTNVDHRIDYVAATWYVGIRQGGGDALPDHVD